VKRDLVAVKRDLVAGEGADHELVVDVWSEQLKVGCLLPLSLQCPQPTYPQKKSEKTYSQVFSRIHVYVYVYV
jgi:hypothetical protein